MKRDKERMSKTGGVNSNGGSTNLLFSPNFPENCRKMKNGGEGGPWRPSFDPPMRLSLITQSKTLST